MKKERLQASPMNDYVFAGIVALTSLGILTFRQNIESVVVGLSGLWLAYNIARKKPTYSSSQQ